MEGQTPRDRVKFYGSADLANFFLVDEAVALIRVQVEKEEMASLNDALEVHNALEFERNGVLPRTLTQAERDELALHARSLSGQIAAFFAKIDGSNVNEHLFGFEREYVQDLLQLIGRFKVAKKVGGQELFEALTRAEVPLWAMLREKQFVTAYDKQLRSVMMSDARHGELLVYRSLLRSSPDAGFLPASLSPDDSQQIFKNYIDSQSPHLNYVEAIANAQDNPIIGITPKIRLAAQRRVTNLTRALLADERNVLIGTGYAVGIDPEQQEPRQDRVQPVGGRTLHQRTFGGRYLNASKEPAQILANFARTIGYMEGRGLLDLPSFPSQIGVLEGLRISGKDAYPRGSMFVRRDSLTVLGTEAYHDFLHQEGIEVEGIVAWYFREYIPEVFDVVGFDYAPSTVSSTFLERCRHICAEMESLVKQFTLYSEEGKIDRELLEMTSAPRPWKDIPSLVERKYLFHRASEECDTALRLLFSDQSSITFINEELKASSFVQLALNNQLHYEDLHHYQTELVDWLIAADIVAVDDGTIVFRSLQTLLVLRDIRTYEAAPFAHYGMQKTAAEELVAKGWLDYRSSLFTQAEASYFNFFLNKCEFSDGYDLRNKYLHGTNPDSSNEDAHRKAYMQLLRLTVALVLKIHDDIVLRAEIVEKRHQKLASCR